MQKLHRNEEDMEKHELDEKIAEASRTILSYCMARTPNRYDAEDLAQDMILEIYRSAANIRDDRAFYGFMWSVAGNVYRQWCKKRQRTEFCELREEMSTAEQLSAVLQTLETDSDISRLRRELALLEQKYRRVTVLYYLENKSCSEIAEILSVSESMVKYLLFKSRQIVREGMNMERNYGEQSYHPKRFAFNFWGGVYHYNKVCDNLLSQNILFACYNDKLSLEQISLEVGVALPYMEENLRELVEYDLLRKDGNRYYTNLVIFTKAFRDEVSNITADLSKSIALTVKRVLAEKEETIRSIGFLGADMDRNTFAWQMSCILLRMAVVNKSVAVPAEYPVDKFGESCFRWLVEMEEETARNDGKKPDFAVGMAGVDNKRGDEMLFMDFKVNGEMVHHYFFNRQELINVFLDIAGNRTDNFSENDRAAAAEMVRYGYVKNTGRRLQVNVPVFTKEQYNQLQGFFSEAADEITEAAGAFAREVSRVLQNHVPVHLKKEAKGMASLRLLEDALSGPMKLLFEEGFLAPVKTGELLPTTYAVLV